jgi:hypothetical protein
VEMFLVALAIDNGRESGCCGICQGGDAGQEARQVWVKRAGAFTTLPG